MTSSVTGHLLMCPPEYFGVTYAINPWMNPIDWARNVDDLAVAAQREWVALHNGVVELGATVELVPPVNGLPDLVFTANAAVVLDRTVLLARFRCPERQPEEQYFRAAFHSLRALGLIDAVRELPDDLVLEGAGDCLWDQKRNQFWMGYGQRSDAAARWVVQETFGADVVALELADPRFYHMDTAFCVLPRGEVIYHPGAFTPKGRAEFRERVGPAERIEIDTDDACRLAANAVCLGNVVIMSSCSERLRAELMDRSYRVATMSVPSFLRSGGSACCLTLQLDFISRPTRGFFSCQTLQERLIAP